MSSDRRKIFARGEEFLSLFTRGAEFTKELMKENERLRADLMSFEDRQVSAARNPEDWDKLRSELVSRIQNLEEEYQSVRERLYQVEEENQQFADRYVEIEEENNNLANLYVASYQLHSTLDLDEVLKIIIEIVINLVGADVFAVYILDESTGELGAAASEGAVHSEFPRCRIGAGAIGKAMESSEPTCWQTNRSDDLAQPIVCIPLSVQDSPIGATTRSLQPDTLPSRYSGSAPPPTTSPTTLKSAVA